MATVPLQRFGACDGFRVEAPRSPIGWVEETWLGPEGEPAAFVVRTIDGRRGLLMADRVVSVLEEDETVVVRADARLLELESPRLEGAGPLHASWSTTGATIEPRAEAAVKREWPMWQIAGLLYAGIAVVAALFMLAAFTIAAALS